MEHLQSLFNSFSKSASNIYKRVTGTNYGFDSVTERDLDLPLEIITSVTNNTDIITNSELFGNMLEEIDEQTGILKQYLFFRGVYSVKKQSSSLTMVPIKLHSEFPFTFVQEEQITEDTYALLMYINVNSDNLKSRHRKGAVADLVDSLIEVGRRITEESDTHKYASKVDVLKSFDSSK